MEHATITLQGSLTHTVRLPNHNEITFVKGRPLKTSDQAIIAYAKSRPAAFGVTLNVVQHVPPRPVNQSAAPSTTVSQRTGQGKFIKKTPVSRPTGETEGHGG